MNISELIKEMEEFKDEFGDIKVMHDDGEIEATYLEPQAYFCSDDSIAEYFIALSGKQNRIGEKNEN